MDPAAVHAQLQAIEARKAQAARIVATFYSTYVPDDPNRMGLRRVFLQPDHLSDAAMQHLMDGVKRYEAGHPANLAALNAIVAGPETREVVQRAQEIVRTQGQRHEADAAAGFGAVRLF